ncbi:MAG: hypothetical protein KDA05_11345 [Phycisphaerales bacterium]|nr:hypothetical protein [Phycisphaerales bacterium]
MNSRRSGLVVAASLLVGITGLIVAVAGPIDPPPGPVGSTNKPLADIEPRTAINATNTPGGSFSLFRITQPGSYYLTGNITGVSGRHGIEIVASGVTVDLCGFDLVGVAGSLDGVTAAGSNLDSLSVLNGSVRNWGQEGVDLGRSDIVGGRVQGVTARDNGSHGIVVESGVTVSECGAHSNGADGFNAGFGSTLANCAARGNTANGFNVAAGCVVTACSAAENRANGFNAASNCTLSNCNAQTNTLNGFKADDACVITSCTA